MLLSGVALAQTIQPEVDESKIPEWVKRQARSPYKVIIESNSVRTKPAAPKVEEGPKPAVKKPPPGTPATAAAVPASKPAAGVAAVAAKPANASTATDPASAVSVAPAVAATPQPAAPEPVPAAAPVKEAEIEPATRTEAASLAAPSAPLERAPLALVKRVEPALSADLIDSRLNKANVVVAFTVNTNGEVTNLSVASTTDSRLNRSVVRAVQAWRYAPIPEPREHMVSFAFTSE